MRWSPFLAQIGLDWIAACNSSKIYLTFPVNGLLLMIVFDLYSGSRYANSIYAL